MSEVSNVISGNVLLRAQRGATVPEISFRFKQSDDSYLDLTTIHQVHMWIRNTTGKSVAQYSIGEGLKILDAPETSDKSLLVLDAEVLLSPGGYSYDIKVFLTETDYFFPIRGRMEVVNNTTA